MKCPKCQSENLASEKVVNWTELTDLSFHLRTRCRNCGTYKYWTRDNMPQEVRNKPWVFSLATLRRIAKGEISPIFLLNRLEGMGMEIDYKVESIPLFSREVDGATQKPTTALV